MDLLSGLLLTGIVVWIITIVIRELFDETISSGLARYFRKSPTPVQDKLMGSLGKVVDNSHGSSGVVRVRIGIEFWNAKLQTDDQRQLPIGAEVKITAVDGMILGIEEHTAS